MDESSPSIWCSWCRPKSWCYDQYHKTTGGRLASPGRHCIWHKNATPFVSRQPRSMPLSGIKDGGKHGNEPSWSIPTLISLLDRSNEQPIRNKSRAHFILTSRKRNVKKLWARDLLRASIRAKVVFLRERSDPKGSGRRNEEIEVIENFTH